jgi:hypothetical protein
MGILNVCHWAGLQWNDFPIQLHIFQSHQGKPKTLYSSPTEFHFVSETSLKRPALCFFVLDKATEGNTF